MLGCLSGQISHIIREIRQFQQTSYKIEHQPKVCPPHPEPPAPPSAALTHPGAFAAVQPGTLWKGCDGSERTMPSGRTAGRAGLGKWRLAGAPCKEARAIQQSRAESTGSQGRPRIPAPALAKPYGCRPSKANGILSCLVSPATWSDRSKDPTTGVLPDRADRCLCWTRGLGSDNKGMPGPGSSSAPGVQLVHVMESPPSWSGEIGALHPFLSSRDIEGSAAFFIFPSAASTRVDPEGVQWRGCTPSPASPCCWSLLGL